MKLVLATYTEKNPAPTISTLPTRIRNIKDLLANLEEIEGMFSDEELGMETEVYGIVKGKRFMTLEEAIEDYVETYGFNAELAQLGY